MTPDVDLTLPRLAIEFAGALFIAGYVGVAFIVLARYRDARRAQLLLIEGALWGLSIKLAATLLRTIELHTWPQIGAFAAIFVLRTLLKRVFVWQQAYLRRGRS